MIHGAPVGQPVANTATVTAVMKIEDENDQLTEIKFTRNAINYHFYDLNTMKWIVYLPYKRTIKGNSSEFDINGQRMSHKEYSAKLEELNIFINSKNFLVYQGKVEEIALKNAKERMHMFEEISESVQFKEDYIKV